MEVIKKLLAYKNEENELYSPSQQVDTDLNEIRQQLKTKNTNKNEIKKVIENLLQ